MDTFPAERRVMGIPAGAEPAAVPLRRGKAAPQRRPLHRIPSGTYTVPAESGVDLMRVELLKNRHGGYDGWFLRGDNRRDGRIPGRQVAELVGRVWRFHFPNEYGL